MSAVRGTSEATPLRPTGSLGPDRGGDRLKRSVLGIGGVGPGGTGRAIRPHASRQLQIFTQSLGGKCLAIVALSIARQQVDANRLIQKRQESAGQAKRERYEDQPGQGNVRQGTPSN